MLEISQLRMISAVGRTGSYSAAARELLMTQPAVTQQMRRLERAIGAPLSFREGRSMRLTPAGEILRSEADQILRDLQRAERRVARAISSHAGVVRLASFSSACATIVTRAIRLLAAESPELRVEMVEAEPAQAENMLAAGDVDLVLTYWYGPTRDIHFLGRGSDPQYLVMTEMLNVLVPRNHRLVDLPVVNPADLLDDTLLVCTDESIDIFGLKGAFETLGRYPRTIRTPDDYVVLQAMVAQGIGMAIQGELTLVAHHHPEVIRRPLLTTSSRSVLLTVKAEREDLPTVRRCVEAITGAAAQQPLGSTVDTTADTDA